MLPGLQVPRPTNPTPSEALAVRLREEADAVGVALNPPQIAVLVRYLRLIEFWRTRARLTSVSDPLKAARRHIADSLICLQAGIGGGASVIDVGSGAGLPGIPLAIVRQDLRMTLLEAEGRKAAFLEMAARELALPLTVVARRAEEAAHDPQLRERFDVAVARAVAPLPALLEMTLPFVRILGQGIFLKGPAGETELEAARRAAEILGGGGIAVRHAGLAGGERRSVIQLIKATPTPPRYPRSPGTPARRPL